MASIGDVLRRNRDELERYERHAARRMLAAYDQMIEALEGEIALLARRVPTLSTERRAMWLESMLAQVRDEYRRWELRALGELDTVAVEGAQRGRTHANRQARAFGLMPVGVGVGRLNIPAAQRLMAALSPESPLRAVLARYGPIGEQIIEAELYAGIASGEGERQITRRVVRQLNAPWLRSRLSATVRTELMRSYRGAQVDTYREMGAAVVGWRWTCARKLDTCLACIEMDGTEYPLDVDFDRAHVNCRCVATPIPAGAWDFGERHETAGDWFADLPAHQQRRMIPSEAAYQAYRNGDLTLADFVEEVHSPLWGTSTVQRSGLGALRAAGLV